MSSRTRSRQAGFSLHRDPGRDHDPGDRGRGHRAGARARPARRWARPRSRRRPTSWPPPSSTEPTAWTTRTSASWAAARPASSPPPSNTVVGTTTYKIDTDVVYVDDPALGQPQTYVNYKKVTVTVTPAGAPGAGLQQTTLVAPPAIGAIAGKSTIIVTVIDALTDQPIAGAPVTADLSTSPTQTRSTGADGKVVFAGLEPSAIAADRPQVQVPPHGRPDRPLGDPPGQRPGPGPAAPHRLPDLDHHAQGLQAGDDPASTCATPPPAS